MRNKTLRGVLVGFVGLMLLVGGLATASNMGFKFVPNVPAGQAFDLALPWFNNYTKVSGAGGLFTDLHAQDADVQKIAKTETNASLTSWYIGAPAANSYNIVKGEAYVIFASPGAIDQAVVVGSHDPSYTFAFTGGQYKNVSPPYHQTFTKANVLFLNMRANTTPTNQVDAIGKYEANAAVTSWYLGAPAANNFNLDLGMGIRTHAAGAATGYVWSHY